MAKTIKQWAEEVHSLACSKGWWEGGVDSRSLGDQFANFHAEISEAWEEYRNGHSPADIYYKSDLSYRDKPEGIGIELADCVIRILDTCEAYGIDLEECIRIKTAYNQTRAYRHNGKKA